MTNTIQPTGDDTVTVQIPSGRELYDHIMSGIEPELVTDQIPLMDAKYAGETPEQNAERLQRYQAAFAEYEKQFQAWTSKMTTLVDRYRREALKIQEEKSREEDTAHLSNLEEQFASLDPSTPSAS